MGVTAITFYFVFCFVAAAIAHNKGNSAALTFLLSLLGSPLIGIIVALVQKPNNAKLEKQSLKSGQDKRCPYCAELVKQAAKICKHCGNSVQVILCPSCKGRLYRPEGPAGATASCSLCAGDFLLP